MTTPARSAAAPASRREFLAQVGRGTLAATIGPALAADLGLAPAAWAAAVPARLHFGAMEGLVALMQETPVAALQAALAEKLKAGVPLRRLVAAGVLANARSFGGEDYIGFHTFMALSPALTMSGEMPAGQAALPVFKVLYRNTARIQDQGGCGAEVLRPADPATGPPSAETLRSAVRAKDKAGADAQLSALTAQDGAGAFEALLGIVQDNPEVHRTVLPYRAWDLIGVVGQEHAATLLRQSLHYCLNAENWRRAEWDEHGKVLTRLLDEHKLPGRPPGTRQSDDAWTSALADSIFTSTPEQAAGAVAAALAEGFAPAAIAEALTLAGSQMVLRDPGRPPAWESKGKPAGSVHGDSTGVHASDSLHAWTNMARIATGRNAHACLILAAWQAARDRGPLGTATPLPVDFHIKELAKTTDQARLLAQLDEFIQQGLQGHASAAVHRWGTLGLPEEPLFQLLLRCAVSEDGALHAEKYYQTVRDAFRATRPSLRWQHATALARVTASEYGRPAPGQAEARELMKA